MAHKFSANIIALDVSPQVLPEFQESDSALRSGEKNRDLRSILGGKNTDLTLQGFIGVWLTELSKIHWVVMVQPFSVDEQWEP